MGRKHCGEKGEIARHEQISLFPTVFSKYFYCRHVKNQGLFGKGLKQLSTVFQLYRAYQCTNPCFPRVLLTSTPHNILPSPLAAFAHNHCRNNGLH